jgi:uroporphyrinogen decarboxylase
MRDGPSGRTGTLAAVSATGRERVEAALRLDRADRPPVSAWGHTYDREWSPADLTATTVAIARRCELDFVKLQIRATCFAEAFGAEWRYSGSASAGPVLRRAGGEDANAWRRIADSEPSRGVLSEQVEVIAAVARELGPDTPCLQTVFSPGMVAWFLAGQDLGRLLGLLRDEPDLMAAGMRRIADTLAWFSRESLTAGAAGVFYAINPVADTAVVSPEAYRASLLQHDHAALAGAEAGWFNMLHLCGPRINASLVAALRPHCVNWSIHDEGNPSLSELRDRDRVAVVGGLHREHPIRAGSVQAVREEAAATLRETGGRGHLLSPGCSVSPWPADREENIRAMAEVAAEA